jgi:nitrogen fixation protein NifZ
MIEPTQPKFQWGLRVAAAVDLFNDGSFPGAPETDLLVAIGTPGEIVQSGTHVETGLPVYMVEFDGQRVVGCCEAEIVTWDIWRQNIGRETETMTEATS